MSSAPWRPSAGRVPVARLFPGSQQGAARQYQCIGYGGGCVVTLETVAVYQLWFQYFVNKNAIFQLVVKLSLQIIFAIFELIIFFYERRYLALSLSLILSLLLFHLPNFSLLQQTSRL